MTDAPYPHDDDVRMMAHLMSYPPHVLDGLNIDPRPGTTLHISPVDTITSFVPRKCQRTMINEDELVPRVCTATSLLNCLRGYAVTVRDFAKQRATNAGDDSFRGGYYIYAIDYQCSVLPGRSLCPMARWIQERWLLPYLAEDQGYSGHIVGKMFINRVTNPGVSTGALTVEVMVAIEGEGAFYWDDTLKLTKGYHLFTVPNLASYFDERFVPEQITYRQVSHTEYMKRKGLRAELLSYSPAAAWGRPR